MVAIVQQDIIDHLAAGDAGNTDQKGKALEDVVEQTMCLIDGVGLIDRNVEDLPGSLEIDLILYNNQVKGTGLPFFPPLLIVECKNWAAPVNTATLRAFTSKIHRMKLKFGLLVAANGITGDADDVTAAHAHLRDVFNRDDEIILVDTSTDRNSRASYSHTNAWLLFWSRSPKTVILLTAPLRLGCALANGPGGRKAVGLLCND